MARLTITQVTLKQLFASSGNRCAFQGCKQPIIAEDGSVLGEVCHIQAANPGGQRYNKEQTDEQRRDFQNLLLLCPTHHKVTDNVRIYTVQVLQEMKRLHERKFRNKYIPIRRQTLQKMASQTNKAANQIESGTYNNQGGTMVINQGLSVEETKALLLAVLNHQDKLEKTRQRKSYINQMVKTIERILKDQPPRTRSML
jgi:hypothetical protein